jgi:DNA-binding beta-propeller fold protein YncE
MRVPCLLMATLLSAPLAAQTILVVQEGPGKVVIFNSANPTRHTSISVGSKPHEIEIAPDGRTAFVTNFGLLEGNHKVGAPGTTISVLDIEQGVERTRFNLPPGFTAPHGLKLRPPAYNELFTNTEEGTQAMLVFNPQSGALVRSFRLPPAVHNFIFNTDGTALFAFTMQGEVLRIDPTRGAITARAKTGSPRGLAWTADRRHLLVSGINEILLLDPASLAIEKHIANLGVGQTFYPTATPDGHWLLVPAVLDGVVLAIDAATGTVAHRIETGSPLLLALSPDGKKAWVSNVLIPPGMFGPNTKPKEGGVVQLDLTTFQTTPVPQTPDANGLAITPANTPAAPAHETRPAAQPAPPPGGNRPPQPPA